MTGTALTEEEEFRHTYQLDVMKSRQQADRP